jgi:hypothetical protein
VLTGEGLAALQRAAPRYAQSIREHLLEPLSRTQRDALARIGETVLRELELSSDSVLAGEVTRAVASVQPSPTGGSKVSMNR